VNRKRCPSEDRLIDYLDGQVEGEEASEIESHLGECPVCAASAEALRRTFDIAAADRVPEPPPAYWEHFGSNVRKRIEGRAGTRRRRLRLVLIPGLAGAAACVLLIVLFTRVFVPPGGDVESIIAELNASVVSEQVVVESGMDELFLGQIGSDAELLDDYLIETGDVHDLVGELDEAEERHLINKLSTLMELRGSVDNGAGKGC
jgi:hypothetical protein